MPISTRLCEVDAVDCFEKAVDEMLARLLAVADDVDAGVFLQLERQQRRVALGVCELFALEPPRRPQFFGSASQAGFGRLPAIVVGKRDAVEDIMAAVRSSPVLYYVIDSAAGGRQSKSQS